MDGLRDPDGAERPALRDDHAAGGVQLGWALQIALVASGFIVPTMFILGVAFGALWWASIHYGRKIDEAKARFAAQAQTQAPGQAPAEGNAG